MTKIPLEQTLESETQTIALGQQLGAIAQPGDCLCLHGELGAGKTRLVRGLAQGMGLDPAQVSSPTFVMLQEYDQPLLASEGAGGSEGGEPLCPLVHIDAYRLDTPQAAESIGWNSDALRRAVVAVEWPSKAPPPVGFAVLHVTIDHVDQTTRHITLEPSENWTARLSEMHTP